MAQPDFISIIQEKNRRLEEIPDRLLTATKRAEKEIYQEVIVLLKELETVDGKFVQSIKNLEIAGRINEQLKGVLLQSEYTTAVTEFASQFNVQYNLNIEYFAKAFQIQTIPEIAAVTLELAKRNAVDMLVNRAADADFIYPLRDIIEQAVVNNSSYKDILGAVREFIEGTPEIDGRLTRYTTLIARDTFAVNDASITAVFAEENGFEWYYYSGDEIKTTRAFCRQRHGEFYHKKEIEAWGAGKKTDGLSLPDSKGTWQGRNRATTESTIFTYRGGYNCGHTIMPVSLFGVPKPVIERNIAQGFYTPTEKERELLEL